MSNYPFDTFPLTKRVGIVNPVANLDARYGPWPTFNDALTGFSSAVRERGLTVAVSGIDGIVEYWYKNGITNNDLVLKTAEGTNFGSVSGKYESVATTFIANSANFPTTVLQLPSNQTRGTAYSIDSKQYGTVYQTVSTDQVYAIRLEPGRTITLFISGNHDSLKRHTVGFISPAVFQFYINGAGQSSHFYTFKNHITKVTLTNPLTSIIPTPRLMGTGTAEVIRTDLNQNQGGLGFVLLESTVPGPTDFLLQENGDRLVIRNFT